jgi:spectinomycin phosphotransferase
MLVQPDYPLENIISCLSDEFGLQNASVKFLPLGADLNTAVYRVELPSGQRFLLKLRSGEFAENSAVFPKLLFDQSVEQVIPPILSCSGKPSTRLDQYCVILYPYIDGKDGFQVELSDEQWVEFGNAVKKIHSAKIPTQMLKKIPTESFSTEFADQLLGILQRIRVANCTDPISADMVEYLLSKEDTIQTLISRTNQLSGILVKRSMRLVVCHSDLHAGNLLIDTQGHLFIVDWDTLLRAPKERDLMFVGGGQGFRGHTLQEEIELFYQGYGKTRVNQEALAYYRYARIIEDLVVEIETILSKEHSEKDRERSLEFMKSNFQMNGVIEIAFQEDRASIK